MNKAWIIERILLASIVGTGIAGLWVGICWRSM
jgi:hypothetical protein